MSDEKGKTIAALSETAGDDDGTEGPEMFRLPSIGPAGTKRMLVASALPAGPGFDEEPDEQPTRFNGAPSAPEPHLAALVPTASPSGAPAMLDKREKPRRVFDIEAVLTTPGGRRFVLRTIDISSKGLFVGVLPGADVAMREGTLCSVLLVHGSQSASFEAEVVRVAEDGQAPAGYTRAFALNIVLLTREQQQMLHRIIDAGSRSARSGRARAWLLAPLALVVVASLVAAAFYVVEKRRAIPVVVAVAKRGPVREVATSLASGEIVAQQRVTVRSTLEGARVLVVAVKQGDRVHEGDVIARSQERALSESLARAQSRLASVEVSYRRARDHAASLRNKNLPEADVKAAEDVLASARGTLTEARAEVEARTAELRKSEVLAPFAGVVVELIIQNGELVQPSSPICELVDDTAFHASVTIEEAEATRVRGGMGAKVWVPGTPEPISAMVERIGTVVKADKKGRRVIAVDLAFAKGVELRAGSSARAEILLDTKENALLVPLRALSGNGATRTAYVVGADGRAELRELVIGSQQGDQIEVTSGLVEGSMVVLDATTPGLASSARLAPRVD